MTHLKLRYLSLLLSCMFGALFFFSGIRAFSQGFPQLFGTGPVSAGTDFYLAFPANWEFDALHKYVRLYISSGVETTVNIYALGQFKGSVTTVPNDIVTFDLSNEEAQIFLRNDLNPLPSDQVYAGKALHIVAEEPIVVYGMNRTDYTSDGMLVLPVNALGREYVVASATSVAGGQQELPSQYMIIAPYDSTQVTITNPQATSSHLAGETVNVVMNKGDVYSAMSVGLGGDLTGAHIVADKPVAVTAGQNCTYLPSIDYPACDHLEEMLLPVESWGTHYQAIPYMNRTRGDTYRVIAGAADADVYVNGVKLATLTQVGGGAGLGWLEFREEGRRPLEFRSNKPISVAQYNNSQTYDNANGSDPFYIVLTPLEQYQQEFIFTTPGNDFPMNFINIIGDSTAIVDAEMTPTGQNNWQPLTSLGGTAYTFPTQIDGKKYKGLSLSITPGAYRIRSSGPLAGYIYAGNKFDSYGYPLSVATANIVGEEDGIAPDIAGGAECNGSVIGNASDGVGDNGIHTNISTIRLHPDSRNYRLNVDPFVAGVSTKANFSLQVKDPSQDATAIVVVTDMAGNHAFDTIRYAAQNVPAISGSPDFGRLAPQTSKEIRMTLRNNGSTPLEITGLLLLDGTSGFEIVDPKGPFTLDPNSTRDITLRFTGSAEGIFLDSLVFLTDCGRMGLGKLRAEVGSITGVEDGRSDAKAGGLQLSIAPNPIERDEAILDYTLPTQSPATVEIFSAAGESLRRISLSQTAPGSHQARIDLRGFAAGVYLCVLHSGDNRVGKVITVLR